MVGSFPLWSLGATSNDVGRYVPTRPTTSAPPSPPAPASTPPDATRAPATLHCTQCGVLAAHTAGTLLPTSQLPIRQPYQEVAAGVVGTQNPCSWVLVGWTRVLRTWVVGLGPWDLLRAACCARSRRSISYICSGAPQPPQLKHLLLLFTVPVPVHRTDRASHFPFSSISTFFRLFPLACHILFFVSFVTSTSGIRKLDREPPSNRTPFVGVSESSLRLFILGSGIQYCEKAGYVFDIACSRTHTPKGARSRVRCAVSPTITAPSYRFPTHLAFALLRRRRRRYSTKNQPTITQHDAAPATTYRRAGSGPT